VPEFKEHKSIKAKKRKSGKAEEKYGSQDYEMTRLCQRHTGTGISRAR